MFREPKQRQIDIVSREGQMRKACFPPATYNALISPVSFGPLYKSKTEGGREEVSKVSAGLSSVHGVLAIYG